MCYSMKTVDKCHLTDLLTTAQQKMTSETEERNKQVQQTSDTLQNQHKENHDIQDDSEELIKNIHRTS